VYRSPEEPATALPDIDVALAAPPELVTPPPAPVRLSVFTRTMDVVSLPFQIGLVLGLAPLRWIIAPGAAPRRS
jgi:hypothetical protein